MAKKAPTEPKGPKGKQLKLPADGMKRTSIAEVDKAAEAFRVARDKRMALTKIEKEKKVLLLEAAKKHGVKKYVYEAEDGEEFEVEYESEVEENVKVKKVKQDEDDED